MFGKRNSVANESKHPKISRRICLKRDARSVVACLAFSVHTVVRRSCKPSMDPVGRDSLGSLAIDIRRLRLLAPHLRLHVRLLKSIPSACVDLISL